MFVRVRVVVFVCLFVFSPFNAVSAAGLTLSEALSLAASHPLLLPADLAVRQESIESLDAGQRGPDTVSLELEDVGGSFPGLRRVESTLSFKRPLRSRALERARLQSVDARVKRSRHDLERLQWEITTRVQTAFHRVLVNQALLETAREASHLASETYAVVTERVEAGRSPEREKLQAEIELSRTMAEQRRLEGDLEESRLLLARELGSAVNDPLVCIGSLTPHLTLPEFEVLCESLLCSHPDLRELDLNTSATFAEQQLLEAEKRPAWSVSAGVRQYREDRAHGYIVALETELPDRRLHRGRLQSLDLYRQKIEAQRQAVSRQLTRLLREQHTRFANARSLAIELSEHILPRTRELQKMALEAYQEGKSDLLELLLARKEALEAGRQHLNALSDLYQAADAIEQLCGMCLVGEAHESPTHHH